MSYRFCSPGLLDDFESSSNMIQNLNGGRDNNPSLQSGGGWFKKVVDPSYEYWTAVYVYPNGTNSYEFIRMKNANTDLGALYYSGGNIRLSINGSHVATSGYIVVEKVPFTLEFHLKRNNTTGIAEVFINGVLEMQYTGSTGDTYIDNIFYYCGAYSTNSTMSNIIIQNTGRIGDMRVAYSSPVAAGDSNDFTGAVNVVGHYAHTNTYWNTATSYTYILDNPAVAAGTISQLQMNVHTPGTIKVALFNSVGLNTFTVKADSLRTLTTTTTGINTFYPGTDFAALNVAAGDYLGFYADSTFKLQQANSANFLYPEWVLSGDWTACSNKSFGAQETRSVAIGALYELTSPSTEGYKGTMLIPTISNTLTDLKFLYDATDGHTFLANTKDLLFGTVVPDIKFMQVNARSRYQGSSPVQNIQLAIKTGGTVYNSTNQGLSTIFAPKTYGWDTNPATGLPWTLSEINSIQIGAIAKT